MVLRQYVLKTWVVAIAALAVVPASPGPAQAAPSGFYVDPQTNAARWVAANPNDGRTAVIRLAVRKASQSFQTVSGSLATSADMPVSACGCQAMISFSYPGS